MKLSSIVALFIILFFQCNPIQVKAVEEADPHATGNVVGSTGTRSPLRKSAAEANTNYIAQCGKTTSLTSGTTEVQSGVASASTPPVDRLDSSSKENKVMALLERRCSICHRPGEEDRKGGGDFSDILNVSELVTKGIIKPGKANDSLLLSSIHSGAMPKEGPKFTAEEKQLVKDWIDGLKNNAVSPRLSAVQSQSATPSQIGPISQFDVEACMNKDLQNLPEEDHRFIRYIDLTHFHNAGKTAEIQTSVKALNKLVNSLSWKKQITNPTPIDPTGTLLRIDLRDYRWTPELWERVASENEFVELNQSPAGRAVNIKTKTGTPVVRGDWFVANASHPPLYHEILYADPKDPRRNFQSTNMEAKLESLLGVDTKASRGVADLGEPIADAIHIGFERSNVARHNRILERYDTPFGGYWKSADFDDNKGKKNIFESPLDHERNGGEMIFTLPNGLMGFLLTDQNGNAINKAPTSIVTDPRRSKDQFQVTNGKSCLDCHQPGYKNRKDEIRDHVLKIAKDSFSSNEKDKVKNLYREDSIAENKIAADQKQYEAALKQTGLQVTDPDPIAATVDTFEGHVDEKSMAAELGTTVEELRDALKKSPFLNRRLGLHDGGEIDRTRFRNEFGELKRALNKQQKREFADSPTTNQKTAPLPISPGKVLLLQDPKFVDIDPSPSGSGIVDEGTAVRRVIESICKDCMIGTEETLASTFSAKNLADADTVVIPELNRNLPLDTKERLLSFVHNGGRLITIGATRNSLDLMNTLFALKKEEEGLIASTLPNPNTVFKGTSNLNKLAPSTLEKLGGYESFKSLAEEIPHNDQTSSLERLPKGSVSLYLTSVGTSTVSITPLKEGSVLYLGWDFYGSGLNSESDAKWHEILKRGLQFKK